MKILPIALLSLCVVGLSSAFAQIGTASFTGIVRDDSGNFLPGVTVSARNNATGLERYDSTGALGTYWIAALPAGTYGITAQIPGFAIQFQKDIHLDVGRSLSINFSMKLSVSGEKLEVTDQPPMIEKSESHIATVVDRSFS